MAGVGSRKWIAIGSDPSCELRVSAHGVAPRHARASIDKAGRLVVQELGSGTALAKNVPAATFQIETFAPSDRLLLGEASVGADQIFKLLLGAAESPNEPILGDTGPTPCPDCGEFVEVDDEFCGNCGKPLNAPTPKAEPRSTNTDVVHEARRRERTASALPVEDERPSQPASQPQARLQESASEEPETGRAGRGRRWPGMLMLMGLALAVAGGVALRGGGFRDRLASLLPGGSSVQPSGPIVEMPPAVVFRGSSTLGPSGSATAVPSPQDVAEAQQAAAQQPGNPRALNDAATLLGEAGMPEQATELFQAAQAVAPSDPTIAYNFSRELYRQGRIDEAVAQANRAIAAAPDLDDARIVLANAAIARQDYDGAQQQLDKIIKQVEVAALVARGVVLLGKGRPSEGLQYFEQALRLAQGAGRGVPEYNLGVASQLLRQFDEAQQHYRNAIQARPALAEAHNNLGTLLLRGGDNAGAFEEFHAAALLNPKNAAFASHLSDTSLKTAGNEDQLVGRWQLEGGSVSFSGALAGQVVAQSAAIPGGDSVTFEKIPDGSYRLTTALAGMQLSTTFRRKSTGAYVGPTAGSEQLGIKLPPGISETGTITFWLGGDTLFGDTISSATGPNVSLKTVASWKARRLR